MGDVGKKLNDKISKNPTLFFWKSNQLCRYFENKGKIQDKEECVLK